MAGKRILAVCGIASPWSFYECIRDWEGELVDSIEFPDHHCYSVGDWKTIVTASRNADLVLTTEKDLVKLERFPFAREKLCAVRVEVEVERQRDLIGEIEERVHLKRRAQ